MNTFARRALLPAVVAALALGTPATASAATTANTTATAAAATGTWAATLYDSNGQASTGKPVSMSWLITSPSVYLSVRNTGTLPLTGQTYTLAKQGLIGSFTATACLGATWTASGTCPSNDTENLGSTTTTGGTDADLPLAPGGSASIKITATRAALITVTLSVSVARDQVRTASTTSS
jgi:hypothetical protein